MDRVEEILVALQPLLPESGFGAKKLLVHAICEARQKAWRTGSGKIVTNGKYEGVLAEGMSPQDVVLEAMRLTISGDRPWNKEKYPDIARHLKWVITSLVANLASSADNKKVRPMPEDADGRVREDRLPSEQAAEPSGSEGEVPAEEDLETEGEEPPEVPFLRGVTGPGAEFLAAEVLGAIADDPELMKVCEHLMDGKKPREIAVAMGLSPKDSYRLKKKLQRRLSPVLGVKA